jgi:ribosomal protein S18 acetylase RimI-like enzyme
VELFEAVRGGVVVHVRAATAEDLDFVVEANRALAEESESVALDVGTLRAGVLALVESRAPGRYWIAEIGGRRVGQLLITYEWSDWRNRMVWWVQSVYVVPGDRRRGVLRALYTHVRREAQAAGAGGLRLYVDTSNTRAQTAYAALGMKGDHYRVLEDMFVELPAAGRAARAAANPKP